MAQVILLVLCIMLTLSARAPPATTTRTTSFSALSQFRNYGKAVLGSWVSNSSAHVCVGATPYEANFGVSHTGAQQFMDPNGRVCTFRNLCVRPRSAQAGVEFVYFRDAAHPLPFEHSNAHGPVFEPPNPLLEMSASPDMVSLVVEVGPIPANYYLAESDVVHVPIIPSYVDSRGHELADFTWPIFYTMLETGMLALDNQVVLFADPLGLVSPFYRSFESLSIRPAHAISKYPTHTCFPWAIAGIGGRWLAKPLLTSSSWRTLHDFVYARYRLPDPAAARLVTEAPEQHAAQLVGLHTQDADIHFVIRYKASGHAFSNYEHIVDELERCYPSAVVTLIMPDELSFKGEVELLSRTSVYITPSGGGAFSSVYLPTGAVVIYGAVCWPASTDPCQVASPSGVCCLQLERYIWSAASPHLHVSYYTYSGPAKALTKNRPTTPAYPSGWLDWDYPVNVSALFELIDRGLYLSKGRSFNTCK